MSITGFLTYLMDSPWGTCLMLAVTFAAFIHWAQRAFDHDN